MDIPAPSLSQFFEAFGQMFVVVSHVWFIVLPPALLALFKVLWMDYINSLFASSIPKVMLEIIPPREIEKSPRLMESIFDGLAGVEKSFTTFETYVQGALPFTFSFEIANDDNGVHFYVRTPVALRSLVEAHFYAQYPNVEIVEVPDYVNTVPKNVPSKEWDLWGTDLQLVKADAYPIRTYHFFQEDVTGKMIDPLAGLIETMGKLPPGQRLWLQYIISPESPGWYKEEGKKVIDEIVKGPQAKSVSPLSAVAFHVGDVLKNIFKGMSGQPEFGSLKEEAKELGPLEFRLTPVQRKVLEALENNLGRNMFRVKMRMMYIGRRENFDKTFVSALMGGIKQFNDSNLNGFKPEETSKTYANYVMSKSRLLYRQRRLFRRYRDRDRDNSAITFVLSTSELATVFHIPDMSVMAPALTRISAKRGGAPGNLPVEF